MGAQRWLCTSAALVERQVAEVCRLAGGQVCTRRLLWHRVGDQLVDGRCEGNGSRAGTVQPQLLAQPCVAHTQCIVGFGEGDDATFKECDLLCSVTFSLAGGEGEL